MKRRFMSIFALAVGVLTLVSSCKKDEEGKMVFKASLESSSQKTSLNSLNILWAKGDSISIFALGASSPVNAKFIAESGGSRSTEFSGTVLAKGPYVAVYPYDSNIRYNASTFTGASIPTEQVATLNGFDPKANVMVAYSTTNSLEFKNVCAYIKFTTDQAYDSIKIISNSANDKLSGKFSVAYDVSNNPSATAITDSAVNYVKLVPAEGCTTIVGGTYVVAIAPNTLQSGFTIECSKDGVTGSLSHTHTSVESFERKTLTTFGTLAYASLEKHSNDYVDLGLSVLWATMNVGATDVFDYGDYFAYGEIEPYYTSKNIDKTNKTISFVWNEAITTGSGNTDVKTYGYYSYSYYKNYQGSGFSLPEWLALPYDETTKNLLPARDAARQNWGGAWRTPSDSNFKELLTSDSITRIDTTIGGVTYIKCTSKKYKYKGNFIFLPLATGIKQKVYDSEVGVLNSHGWYMTQRVRSTSYCYYAHICPSQLVYAHDRAWDRYLGTSVRPVKPNPNYNNNN